MDFPLDIDLGELVLRHHVVVTGIEFGETVDISRFRAEIEAKLAERVARISRGEVPGGLGISVSYRELTPHDLEPVGTRKMEPSLHYKFVPGIETSEEEGDRGFWYWMLSVSDDIGTRYRDDNGGAKDQSAGGAATSATRDIGGHIPAGASRLLLRFTPPHGWMPPEPWSRELQLDLTNRSVLDRRSSGGT